MTFVSVVVPTCRRPQTLRATLEALLAVDYPPEQYRIVVVDDANDPATSEVVEGLDGADRVRLLFQDQRGAATARNTGARAAEGELLLFCDDDMIVQRSHLRLHVDTHRRLGKVMVGSDRWYSPASLAAFESTPFGRYRIALERQFQRELREHRIEGNLSETPTLAACDLSIAREAFWAIGGFDEAFPYAGAEDQDLSMRVKAAGYRLIRNYDVTPQHDDPTVTLRQFCTREERGAATVVVLDRKHPGAAGAFAENAPLRRGDPPRLVARKILKAALSAPPVLDALHRFVGWLERRRLSEPVLWRLYRTIIGLHIFRGYRAALREDSERSRRAEMAAA